MSYRSIVRLSAAVSLSVFALFACGSSSSGNAAGGSPLMACPMTTDPCYLELLQARKDISTCLGHSAECSDDTNTDATLCAVGPDVTGPCQWPDGAHQDFDPAMKPYLVTYTNAAGNVCMTQHGLIDVALYDGRAFHAEFVDLDHGPILHCPSGKTFAYPAHVNSYACESYLPSICCVTDASTCGKPGMTK